MTSGNLPPFMGYLPPVVDGTLLELMNMSYPRARSRLLGLSSRWFP